MSLGRYVLTRISVAVPVLLGVTALTFSFIHALPGDPIDALVGFRSVSPATEASIRAEYHLDRPLWEQYLLWLRNVLVLEFGESPVTGRNVAATVGRRLPATLALGGAAWLLALAIGVPTGIVAAVRRGGPADELSRLAALAGIATPNFWLGLVLLLVFGVRLGWVRVIPPDAPLASPAMAKFMLLPTITLGTASAAVVTRLLRSSMIAELDAAYVRTARAKGLRERTVILKHVLRNALLPVVTITGLQLAFLIDGAVVVERIFSWPGMGRLLVRSILQRDYPVIQAGVLLVGVSIVLANLLVDIVYAVLDPRIRY
ncbi:ABC transporter permease [Natrinema altunense]|uniref:Binding-protein-dependent transporters inner membrane component n=1 Tax=Natrinema altunense (strain JCM 12890 / CGMCC 1.3731 / AJ2) TaxID=1227494 RepID=L9ZXE0_NATA2|nr:ABC transporter permease [Natrinema altunense]ELY91170.1 binding-protein-dependent transporters inner membrane component [Natrinema altunense JCM 12890]